MCTEGVPASPPRSVYVVAAGTPSVHAEGKFARLRAEGHAQGKSQLLAGLFSRLLTKLVFELLSADGRPI